MNDAKTPWWKGNVKLHELSSTQLIDLWKDVQQNQPVEGELQGDDATMYGVARIALDANLQDRGNFIYHEDEKKLYLIFWADEKEKIPLHLEAMEDAKWEMSDPNQLDAVVPSGQSSHFKKVFLRVEPGSQMSRYMQHWYLGHESGNAGVLSFEYHVSSTQPLEFDIPKDTPWKFTPAQGAWTDDPQPLNRTNQRKEWLNDVVRFVEQQEQTMPKLLEDPTKKAQTSAVVPVATVSHNEEPPKNTSPEEKKPSNTNALIALFAGAITTIAGLLNLKKKQSTEPKKDGEEEPKQGFSTAGVIATAVGALAAGWGVYSLISNRKAVAVQK